MKPRLFIPLVVATLAGPLSAAEKFEPSAPENPAVAANTRFALNLYRQLSEENSGKNLFFSPFSITSALAMTAEGARGQTALEMGTVLGFSEDLRNHSAKLRPWAIEPIHRGIGKLNDSFNDEAKKTYALSVANAVWVERTYTFSDDFAETINESYGTHSLQPADFIGSADEERKRINAWVERATLTKIKDLLPEGSLDPLTRFVLANAIYFKGDWESPFLKSNTRDRDFHTGKDEKVTAPMMSQRGVKVGRYAAFNADGTFFETPRVINYSEPKRPDTYPGDDGFAMAELPYEGGDISMVLIAPNSSDGLPELEEKLNEDSLGRWIAQLKRREIHMTMPRFGSETTYNLNKTLSSLGMPTAFTREANFDGMYAGKSNAQLYLGLVIHKAFVEVNETGTEAAAATAVVVKTESAPVSAPFVPRFRADRPFVYLIRDVHSGAILFLGRVVNPVE